MMRARYRRIVFFFSRILLSIIFWDLFLPRIGLRGRAEATRPRRIRHYAISFRQLAVHMGGVLIKVGQFLSTRVDVLPPEFTDELKGLQDEVPPVSLQAIRQVAEPELGAPIEEVFAFFDQTPLAAASLGQVHRARLKKPALAEEAGGFTGLEVVVKVQRPDMERIINTDLAALRTVGGWLHRYPPIRKRANVPALLDEFTKILHEEIDYLAEGHNAEKFAENFKHNPKVRVPHVIWPLTSQRVLTLENVLGIKITDYEAITASGISRSEVAGRLLDTYLQQIFEDGFFHADPHPGNLFVDPNHSAGNASVTVNWQLTFIDFGMVAHLPDNLRDGLREMLIGVGTKDAARVVHSYQMMDLLLPGADLEQIERAGERVFERFWGKNMTELTSIEHQEIKQLTDEFRDLVYEMPFQVPQDVIFLGRAVGILSGMCTGLDPNFNLWEHLAPYARKLMAEEVKSNSDIWLGEIEKFARTLWLLPSRIDRVLARAERGELSIRNPDLLHQTQRMEAAIRQVAIGIVFAALLLSGVQLYIGDEPYFALIFIGAAFIDFLWLIRNGRSRNGR